MLVSGVIHIYRASDEMNDATHTWAVSLCSREVYVLKDIGDHLLPKFRGQCLFPLFGRHLWQIHYLVQDVPTRLLKQLVSV